MENQIDSINNLFNNDNTINCSIDTGFIAFEKQMNFSSLRYELEKSTQLLEDADNLWESNNPDDHFIIDDFIRTIVNPDLEFGLKTSVYKFINDYTIIEVVDDINTLQCIRSNINNIKPCLVNTTTHIHTLTKPNEIISDFYFNIQGLTVTFFNSSINGDDYYWDFGDGASSSIVNPTHNYNSNSDFVVTLIASKTIDGNKIYDRKKINIKLGDCNTNFIISPSSTNPLEITFQGKSTSTSYYNMKWVFGDGTSKSCNGNCLNETHTYTSAGNYKVSLTIRDANDCISTYQRTIKVGPDNSDCIKYKSTGKKYKKYANNTKSFKYKFKVINGPIHHRIKAKVVNYNIKSNGSLKRDKADVISANYSGTFYNSKTCGNNSTPVNYPAIYNNKVKSVCKSVNMWGIKDYDKVRVINDEIIATFYVSDEGYTFSYSTFLKP